MENTNTVSARMALAGYTRTYDNLMGGTRLGLDDHVLRRSVQRFYENMTFELLSENIAEVLQEMPDMEDILLDTPVGSKLVILRESDGFTFSVSYDINSSTGNYELFVHTVLVHDGTEGFYIFVEEGEICLKLCKDGTVEENANEFRLRDGRKERIA